MKTIFSILGIGLMIALVMSACSKDDDPADNNFFIGTYNGTISYAGNGDDVPATDGSVTVVKAGSDTKYSFKFSNGIPDINNVEFEKKGDNVLVNIGGEEGVNYIRIDAHNLKMLFIKDGDTWTADCNR